MHHVKIDDWSRGESILHRRDPRAKLLALITLLAAIAGRRAGARQVAAEVFLALLTVSALARLPVAGMLRKSLLVLPFCFVFALLEFAGGRAEAAWDLIARSYVCGFVSLLFMATTPWTSLLRALEQIHVPRFLLTVLYFLYRYLFVLFEEAQLAREAALSRGGLHGTRGFRAAAGALGVLFARSYSRANLIYQAMLCRGYSGTLPAPATNRLGLGDVLMVVISATLGLGAWVGISR